MSNPRSISVIIPNYNGRQLLHDYLPFTFAVLNESGADYEVIIVDDCSKDDSVEFIKQHYPQVHLLVNPANRGFSYTCNQGIRIAQKELIFLLNSDVKLLPGYFEPQWKYFDNADTFGVTGRIIDMEGNGIQDAARMPGFKGFKIKTKFFYYSSEPGAQLLTFYLSGANALVNANKLKQLGGFDEIYSPFYYEDLDLGLRAWRTGWKCYYEHEAVCRHRLSATTKNYKTANWVKSVYFRNRYIAHAIHLQGMRKFMWFLQATFVDLLPKILSGQWWMLKSYINYLKNTSAIRASRKRNHKLIKDNHIHKSVEQVFGEIRQSVVNKSITTFKVKG